MLIVSFLNEINMTITFRYKKCVLNFVNKLKRSKELNCSGLISLHYKNGIGSKPPLKVEFLWLTF